MGLELEINEFDEQLDNNDPLSNLRSKFYIPKFQTNKSCIYLSGNSLGLQPKNAKDYVNEELESWQNLGVEGHLESKRPWFNYHENLISYSAEIVGGLNSEVVVMNSLTVNLHLLMVSFYRPAGKRKKILIENQAFPSDIYAIKSQIKFHGNDPSEDLIIIKSDDNECISTNTVLNYLEKYKEEIALVLIGAVNYYTGQAFDIKTITDQGQKIGSVVGFDLAHATGNIKLNLHDWGVDFAAWCGYKYLNGGPGAPSGIFIHKKHLGKTNYPRFEGWWGHNKMTRFDCKDEFIPIETVEAWQLSNPPILSMAALLASLKLFHEVGMDQLLEKSNKLTSYLEKLIILKLSKQIKIITPNSYKSRGCQLSLKLYNPIDNIIDHLKNRHIICDWRNPNVIRVAPVPFYNSFKDCYIFVQVLKNILNENKK